MLSENKKILNAEIIKKESKTKEKIKQFLQGIYAIFFYIVKNPLDNFWWECISISIQYLQLITFIFEETVSIFLLKYSFGVLGTKKI